MEQEMKRNMIKVLIMEDDDADYQKISRDLKKAEEIYANVYNITRCVDHEEGLNYINSEVFDICFIDYGLGVVNDENIILNSISENYDAMPIILITGHSFLEIGSKIGTHGIYGFIKKEDMSPNLIGSSIRYSMKQFKTIKKMNDLMKFMDVVFQSVLTHIETYKSIRELDHLEILSNKHPK